MREDMFSFHASRAYGSETEESASQYPPVAAAMIQKPIL